MWRRVDFVGTDVPEEHIASVFRVEKISDLGVLALISSFRLSDSFHPDDGGDTFLRNVGSYNSHTKSHPRRLHLYHD
jgi:hypothetical protein